MLGIFYHHFFTFIFDKRFLIESRNNQFSVTDRPQRPKDLSASISQTVISQVLAAMPGFNVEYELSSLFL